MFEEATAAQLAAGLDQVQTLDLHYTGPLSMLDEATLRWTRRYPDLTPYHREFSNAWDSLHRQEATGQEAPSARQRVRKAAAALADKLRELGQARLALCTAPTGWGRCCVPLDDDGQCATPQFHLTGQEG
jgi:hypothetical protein